MMFHISKINIGIMLFVFIVGLFVCTACSGSSAMSVISPSPPDGYLATDSNSVGFIQFTEQHNRLNGHMEGIEETNDVPVQTKPYNYTFTGIQNGTSINITFAVLWTSTSFSGTFIGDTITLEVPQSDGHIETEIFKGASTQQYNQAVDALQKQVSQQDQQYYDVQATATAVQVTAIAQQNEQDDVSNANYYLGNALNALKSDGDNLAAFSETSTLNEYASSWQQMQNDYATEQNAAANGCGNANYGTVQADAGSVNADDGSIQADDGSLSADKSQYDLDLSAVQNDIQALNNDWAKLQNAAKANTTRTTAPAYAQGDIDTGATNAQNAENTASNTWQSAKTNASTYDSEASDLLKKADALPSSMGCI